METFDFLLGLWTSSLIPPWSHSVIGTVQTYVVCAVLRLVLCPWAWLSFVNVSWVFKVMWFFLSPLWGSSWSWLYHWWRADQPWSWTALHLLSIYFIYYQHFYRIAVFVSLSLSLHCSMSQQLRPILLWYLEDQVLLSTYSRNTMTVWWITWLTEYSYCGK